MDEGCLMLASADDAAAFVAAATKGKVWPREPSVRPAP
jgi:hypothetical protein